MWAERVLGTLSAVVGDRGRSIEIDGSSHAAYIPKDEREDMLLRARACTLVDPVDAGVAAGISDMWESMVLLYRRHH